MGLIFDHEDYRIALRILVEERRRVVPSMTFQRIAEACGIQKTYLSRVIATKAHLSSDQLYKVANYLNLDPEARKYLLLGLENLRSHISERKREIQAEMEVLKRKEMKTERHIPIAPIDPHAPTSAQELFLDPMLQIVLMFLTITRFQKAPELISEVMRVSRTEVAHAIEKLLRLNLVQIKGKQLLPLEDKFHLPADASIYAAYRTMVRARTLGYLHSGSRPEDYFFSVLFSANEATVHHIRKKFLNLLRETESSAGKATKTHVYQMNFDLFSWSRDNRG